MNLESNIERSSFGELRDRWRERKKKERERARGKEEQEM